MEKCLGYSRLVCLELWEQSFNGGLHRGWITLIQYHSAPVAQTWDISYWVYDKTQLIYFCLLTEESSWPPCALCILCALCALVKTGVTKLSLYLLAMVYINWVCQFKCQELGSALSGGEREGGTDGGKEEKGSWKCSPRLHVTFETVTAGKISFNCSIIIHHGPLNTPLFGIGGRLISICWNNYGCAHLKDAIWDF